MDIKNEEKVEFAFHYKVTYELEAHSSFKFSQKGIRIP